MWRIEADTSQMGVKRIGCSNGGATRRRPADKVETAVGASAASGGAARPGTACTSRVSHLPNGVSRSSSPTQLSKSVLSPMPLCCSWYFTVCAYDRRACRYQDLTCRQGRACACQRSVMRPCVRVLQPARRYVQGIVLARRRPMSAG